MSHHKQHFLVPNSQSIDDLAKLIWAIAQKEQVSPIVILSTSGPAYGLRQTLDLHRPKDMSPHLVFLPRVLGLTQWLKETPGLRLEGEAKTNLARWLEVYQALSARPQLRSILMDASESSKWGLAKNIIDACDIISEASLGISDLDAEKALRDAIDQVYQGASRVAIDTESKILLTFWQNLTSLQDPIARQRQAMYWRANEAQKKLQIPLIYVETAKGSPGFDQVLNHFLKSYASQSAVHHFVMDFSSVALWPECVDDESKDQIIDNQNQYFEELKSSDRKIIKSISFEDAAWSGANAIQEFLKDGHHHIALIAQDRLVARRIRALLARLGSGISIHDETGWKLSTTRAASALMSWIEVIRQPLVGPSAAGLLEFLKNPYIDWSALGLSEENASHLIHTIEARLIESDSKGGWSGMVLALGHQIDGVSFDAAIELVKKLRGMAQRWQSKPLNCETWLGYLFKDFKDLAMYSMLLQDLAGKQLLEALEPMNSVKAEPLRLSEWLSLINSMIEDASYVEASPRQDFSITILPLSATRLRRFDAWVMVGCDDGQLPSISDSPMFLSASLKKMLRCKSSEAEFIQQALDLSQLMMAHQNWRMIWQAKGSSGEPRQASPWLQRLYKNHSEFLNESQEINKVNLTIKAVHAPSPSVPSDFDKPLSISPSAYKTLRECPYRYYASRLLGLKEHAHLDAEVDLSLVGQTLHAALKNFHQGLKTKPFDGQLEGKKSFLENLLKNISKKHFQPLLDADGRWLAAWVQWESQIPSWIDWELAREIEGWHFHDGEITVGFDLQTKFGAIRVAGQVDRIDLNPKFGAAIIDYKYSSATSIKFKQKNIEDDPQLIIYAKALNGDDMVDRQLSTSSSWVSIKEEDVEVAVDNLELRMSQLPAQMIADVEKVWDGFPLKASAPDGICQYCSVRGLCRKGMWS